MSSEEDNSVLGEKDSARHLRFAKEHADRARALVEESKLPKDSDLYRDVFVEGDPALQDPLVRKVSRAILDRQMDLEVSLNPLIERLDPKDRQSVQSLLSDSVARQYWTDFAIRYPERAKELGDNPLYPELHQVLVDIEELDKLFTEVD